MRNPRGELACVTVYKRGAVGWYVGSRRVRGGTAAVAKVAVVAAAVILDGAEADVTEVAA